MVQHPQVANDVYQRYGLKWADFPHLITPSAHSDEAELFCARQSLAVYGVYPNTPHAPGRDYIPSRLREAIAARTFSVAAMIERGADLGGARFEAPQGFRTVVTDQAGALLVWEDKHLIIGFRGTANWQDWIHNLTKTPIAADTIEADSSYRLHKGFTGLASNLFPAVTELIEAFARARGGRGRDIHLTICGHSLGGALALNFAAQWRRDWESEYRHWRLVDEHVPRLAGTYTFGTPRIGTGEIWRMIVRPHYRLIVRGDPVPMTPPNFASDFQATFLEKPSKAAVQPKGVMGMAKRALGSLAPRIGFDVEAHEIEGYIEAIERKIASKA
ncbi:MAG: lipase family protein [Alphaproteobacteria bacterium]